MRNKTNIRLKNITRASIFFLVMFGIGCSGMNRLGRSYEQKPFDSKKWRDGDAQERGTMFIDLTRKRIATGKTKEEVLELLGEPGRKATINGSETWYYKVEFAGQNPAQEFPVTFDKNGKATMRVGLDGPSFDDRFLRRASSDDLALSRFGKHRR